MVGKSYNDGKLDLTRQNHFLQCLTEGIMKDYGICWYYETVYYETQ